MSMWFCWLCRWHENMFHEHVSCQHLTTLDRICHKQWPRQKWLRSSAFTTCVTASGSSSPHVQPLVMVCTKAWIGCPALCPQSAELIDGGRDRGSLLEIAGAFPCVVDAFQQEFAWWLCWCLLNFLAGWHILVKQCVLWHLCMGINVNGISWRGFVVIKWHSWSFRFATFCSSQKSKVCVEVASFRILHRKAVEFDE